MNFWPLMEKGLFCLLQHCTRYMRTLPAYDCADQAKACPRKCSTQGRKGRRAQARKCACKEASYCSGKLQLSVQLRLLQFLHPTGCSDNNILPLSCPLVYMQAQIACNQPKSAKTAQTGLMRISLDLWFNRGHIFSIKDAECSELKF